MGLQSRIWIGDPARSDSVKAHSEFVQAVKERFDDAGIDMPYPHRELTGDVGVANKVDVARVSSQSTSSPRQGVRAVPP